VKFWLFTNAPAHTTRVCAGVFLFCAAIAACEDGVRLGNRGPRTLELHEDTVQLQSGVKLHDIKIRSTQAGDFEPTQVTAKVGDVVRFTSADTRTHALSIQPPSEQARAALAAEGQLRSPPLIAHGTAWVVSLKGVPAGTYTVSCLSHAGTASVVVQ
jgi:plastocyanin